MSNKHIKEQQLQRPVFEINVDQPEETYTTEDYTRMLLHQDRMVVDLKDKAYKGKENEALRKQGSIDATRQELDEIDKLLDMYTNNTFAQNATLTKEIIEQDIGKLKFKRAMDLAQILVNDHTKSDSKEMQDVKVDLVKVCVEMERMNSLPATQENINDLNAYFALALKSTTNYLMVKNPKYSKGSKRYQKVYDVQGALSMIKSTLDYMTSDAERFEGKTIGELLGMRKNENGDVSRTVNEKQHTLSKDAAFVKELFSEDHEFCTGFKGARVSASKKRKGSAKVMALKAIAKSFVPNTTQLKDVEIMGKKVRLLQKADNRLYIVEKHRMILLDKTAESVSNNIESEVLSNPQAYGNDRIEELLTSYTEVKTTGEATRARTNLIAFLKKRLGLKDDDFTNIVRTGLISYVRRIINKTGSEEDIKKEEEDIKKEILSTDTTEKMINGVEMTELMELEKGQEEEIDQRVSVYQLQNEAEDNDWNPEEKSVKNLMAEFIFTTDTQIMDSNVSAPEEFVRTVLTQNAKALAILIKENKEEGDMLSSIFKKMSLDDITGDDNESFEKVIAAQLRGLKAYFAEQVGTEGTVDEIAKRLEDKLSDKNNTGLKNVLKAANTEMEKSIKKSCEIMQDNVNHLTKSIFDNKAVKKEEKTLKSIIENSTVSDKGQGKFVRNVFENYFKSVSVLDQRAILASVLRTSKKVNYRNPSDEELIKDIKEKKIPGYESIIKEERKFDSEPLTEEEKAKLDEYRNEKKRLSSGANYLGGMVRGAGPLFHKMMQGLPEKTLPDELRVALEDVKSNLPPLPERVVKSQIYAMVKRSGGDVTKIEVLGNAGAASVSQTFICKLYGPKIPAEGKNVIIKILRSDVQNRMKREEKVMLKCAEMTDKGMKATYEGQLPTYYDELNLIKENDNILAGDVYNQKKVPNVVTETVNTDIKATVNTLVLDQAPGKTLNKLIKDEDRERIVILNGVKKKIVQEDGSITYSKSVILDHTKLDKLKEAKNKILDKISDLVKKRDIMANACNAWVDEAMFKSGYYHADLHGGNIMISDDTATLIDFGNAVSFTKEQQTAITKMVSAAAMGGENIEEDKIDVFFNSFNSLLDFNDEEFAKFYDGKKQDEVKKAFAEVLKMGGEKEVGERIAATLIVAQQMGVKLPPAIYNFSQGQQRLQASINELNDLIKKYKEDLISVETACDMSNQHDALAFVQRKVHEGVHRQGENAKDVYKSYLSIFEPIDKETFIKELLDNEYKEAKVEKGIAGVDKRADFEQKYLDGILDYKKLVRFGDDADDQDDEDEDGNPWELPDFSEYRRKWETYKSHWGKLGRKNSAEHKEATQSLVNMFTGYQLDEETYKSVGGENLGEELKKALHSQVSDEKEIDNILKAMEAHIDDDKKVEFEGLKQSWAEFKAAWEGKKDSIEYLQAADKLTEEFGKFTLGYAFIKKYGSKNGFLDHITNTLYTHKTDTKKVEDILSKYEQKLSKEEFAKLKNAWNEYRANWGSRGKRGDEGQIKEGRLLSSDFGPQDLDSPAYKIFGGKAKLWNGAFDALEIMDEGAVEEILLVYEKLIPKRAQLEDKIKELRQKQDSKKLSVEERNRLTNEIYDIYNELHSYQAQNNPITGAFITGLYDLNNIELVRKHIEPMFKVPVYGKELEEKYNKFIEVASPYRYENGTGLAVDVPSDARERIKQAERELKEAHIKAAHAELKSYYEGRFERQPEIKSYDFTKVMRDVVSNNIEKVLKAMGYNDFAIPLMAAAFRAMNKD